MQSLKGFILLALFALYCSATTAEQKLGEERFFMKNGYDPLLNMMSAANGAVQGYISQWVCSFCFTHFLFLRDFFLRNNNFSTFSAHRVSFSLLTTRLPF